MNEQDGTIESAGKRDAPNAGKPRPKAANRRQIG
jgi:hypothetical protein